MVDILLVEDDKDIQIVNKNMLEDAGGYNVRLAMNLAEARERVQESAPDVIVLDVMLPDGSGLDFLTELRQDADIPVLFLTAKGKKSEIVQGLQAGGDDYLAKPYDYDELLARIESLLRRAERVPKSLNKGSLKLDFVASRASIGGVDLNLTHKEFVVLLVLARNEGKAISAEFLYEKAWGRPMAGDKNAVQMAVSRLRNKIEPAGYGIPMIRGRGYVFEKIKKF